MTAVPEDKKPAKKIIEASIDRPGDLLKGDKKEKSDQQIPLKLITIKKPKDKVIVSAEVAKVIDIQLNELKQRIDETDFSALKKCLEMDDLNEYIKLMVSYSTAPNETDTYSPAVKAFNRYTFVMNERRDYYYDNPFDHIDSIQINQFIAALATMIHRATPVPNRYTSKLVIPQEVIDRLEKARTALNGLSQYDQISGYLRFNSYGSTHEEYHERKKSIFEQFPWMNVPGFMNVPTKSSFDPVFLQITDAFTINRVIAFYRNSKYIIPTSKDVAKDSSNLHSPTFKKLLESFVSPDLKDFEQREDKSNTFENANFLVFAADRSFAQSSAFKHRGFRGDGPWHDTSVDLQSFENLVHRKEAFELESKVRKGEASIQSESYAADLLRKVVLGQFGENPLTESLDFGIAIHSQNHGGMFRRWSSDSNEFVAPTIMGVGHHYKPNFTRLPIKDKPITTPGIDQETLIDEIIHYAAFVKRLYTKLFTNMNAGVNRKHYWHPGADESTYPEVEYAVKNCEALAEWSIRKDPSKFLGILTADPETVLGRKYDHHSEIDAAYGLEWCAILKHYHTHITGGRRADTYISPVNKHSMNALPTTVIPSIMAEFTVVLNKLKTANAAFSKHVSDSVTRQSPEPFRLLELSIDLHREIVLTLIALHGLNNQLVDQLIQSGVVIDELYTYGNSKISMLMHDSTARARFRQEREILNRQKHEALHSGAVAGYTAPKAVDEDVKDVKETPKPTDTPEADKPE